MSAAFRRDSHKVRTGTRPVRQPNHNDVAPGMARQIDGRYPDSDGLRVRTLPTARKPASHHFERNLAGTHPTTSASEDLQPADAAGHGDPCYRKTPSATYGHGPAATASPDEVVAHVLR